MTAPPAGSRLMSLADAVREYVRDGDCIFVGGFGQAIPFATAHEIIRQRRRDLVLCRSGADILFDLMIAAGCVSKVITGFIGNPGVGLANAFRRAAEAGRIEVEDWTNFAMVLRLHAGAMGVPFLPTATLAAGDIAGRLDVRPVVCPYSGERLVAVPALNPDVAIVHAQRGDAAGNIQLTGLSGDTVEGAMASERIIATVEEIVPAAEIRKAPDRTIIPGFRVAAVCHRPWGAYPSYVDGFYGRDDEAYGEWDSLSRDPERLEKWIDDEVRNVADFGEYLGHLDPARRAALAAAAGAGRAP